MAKTPATTTTTEVAPVPPAPPPARMAGAPPAELAELMKEDRGKGVSSSQADNLIPLIYVLQANSPQINHRNPAYITGAEVGAFWLRNAPHPIIQGERGMVVQPCHFFKDWIEWRPRDSGGGFIARHPARPDADQEDMCPVSDARKTVDPNNPNRVRHIRPNGNEVIMNRNHIIRVYTPEGVFPYLLALNSTGHTTSRTWMTMINTQGGEVSFAAKYRLTTRERSNQLGVWFAIDVKWEDWCDGQEYKAGKSLYEAFARGERVLETPTAESRRTDDEIPF